MIGVTSMLSLENVLIISISFSSDAVDFCKNDFILLMLEAENFKHLLFPMD